MSRLWYSWASDISEILTVADQCKVIYDLSNGAVFHDLEWPQTQISRSVLSRRRVPCLTQTSGRLPTRACCQPSHAADYDHQRFDAADAAFLSNAVSMDTAASIQLRRISVWVCVTSGRFVFTVQAGLNQQVWVSSISFYLINVSKCKLKNDLYHLIKNVIVYFI